MGGRRRAADRGHSRRWTQDAVFGGLSICGGPLRVSGCGPPTYSAASRQLGRFRFRPHPCRRCRRPDPSSCSSCVVRRSACRLRKGADARQRLPKGYNAAHNDGQQAAVPHCQELRTHRTQQPAQETAPVVQSFSPGPACLCPLHRPRGPRRYLVAWEAPPTGWVGGAFVLRQRGPCSLADTPPKAGPGAAYPSPSTTRQPRGYVEQAM